MSNEQAASILAELGAEVAHLQAHTDGFPIGLVRPGSPGYPVGAKVIKEAGEVADMTIDIGNEVPSGIGL